MIPAFIAGTPMQVGSSGVLCRCFTTTARRLEIRDARALPKRIQPAYKESLSSSLLSLRWPKPPRNVLIVPKLMSPKVTESAIVFARHLQTEYPTLNLIFEKRIAEKVHESLSQPIFTSEPTHFPNRVDVVATLGGDGTILRAASLFSLHESVPPVIAFSMGTLGFLGEWKFDEFKRAWREVYMSGGRVSVSDLQGPHTQTASGARDSHSEGEENNLHEAWEHVRGKSLGTARSSKILLRNRLKVGIYDQNGVNVNGQLMPTSTAELHQPVPQEAKQLTSTGQPATPAFHAINELVIHRGPNPHLAIIDVFVDNHFLTEAVADGILVSTPTGSTAYSLSAGGSIMHPLVKVLLITPICARSLSFRPLGLPLNTKVVLKISEKNRGRELEVSIDGKRTAGITIGMEIRVEGEMVGPRVHEAGSWNGGVPCVIRTPPGSDNRDGIAEDDDGWVGGLNGLLKFNYPFGE